MESHRNSLQTHVTLGQGPIPWIPVLFERHILSGENHTARRFETDFRPLDMVKVRGSTLAGKWGVWGNRESDFSAQSLGHQQR